MKNKMLYKGYLGIRPHLLILCALTVLMVIMSLLAPNFLTGGNLLDILRVNSIKGIMSIAMTLVLVTGGIDLSVGSTFALSGAVSASLIAGSYSDYITRICSNAIPVWRSPSGFWQGRWWAWSMGW